MTTEAPGELPMTADETRAASLHEQGSLGGADPVEDDEAAAEAMAELERLDQAEQFRPGPAARPPIERYVAPIPPPQRTYTPPSAPRAPMPPPMYPAVAAPAAPTVPTEAAPPAWTTPGPKDLKTLEDLYASFPAIGDGNTFLRIERTQPKVHGGHAVAGWLGDLHEQIPMDEFAYRYGGQKYTVSVMIPVRPRGAGGDQEPKRRAASVEITIPGAPAMGTVPREEDQMTAGRMPGTPNRGGLPQYFGQDPTEVQLRRLDMEAAEKQRQADEARQMREQMAHAARPPEQLIESVREQAKETVKLVEANAAEKVDILRSQNNALLLSHKEIESKHGEAQRQVTELQRQLGEAKYHTETKALADAKEKYESELRKSNDMHASEMARLAEAHRTQLSDMSIRNNEERQRLIEAETREKDRIRGDARDREVALRADIERRERDAQKTTDSRVADIQRQMDQQLASMRDMQAREIASLKDAHAREMNAIRTAEEMKTSLANTTMTVQVGSVQDRLQRAESDAARYRQEAEDLRAKVNKPFPEAMREAKEMGQLLGLVEKGDAAPAEEELDWKKVVASGVKGLVDQAGPTIKAVMDARAANQQQAAQQQAYAQQQQQQAAMAQQQQQVYGQFGPAAAPQQQQTSVMAGRQPPRRRFAMAPPPSWAQSPGPPPPGSAPMAPPPMVQGPVGNPPATAYIQPPPAAVSMQPQYGPSETPANEEVRMAHSPLDGPVPTEAGMAAQAAAAATRGETHQAQPFEAPVAPPPLPYVGPPQQQAQQYAAPVAPATGGYVSRFSPQQAFGQEEEIVQQQPTQQLALVPASAPAPTSSLELTSDQVASFIDRLGTAAQMDFPAASFAEEFIKQAGRDTAAHLMQQVSPQALLKMVEAAGGQQSAIYSPKGQAYTHQVWGEARRILGI